MDRFAIERKKKKEKKQKKIYSFDGFEQFDKKYKKKKQFFFIHFIEISHFEQTGIWTKEKTKQAEKGKKINNYLIKTEEKVKKLKKLKRKIMLSNE